jgi:hypothetical protein
MRGFTSATAQCIHAHARRRFHGVVTVPLLQLGAWICQPRPAGPKNLAWLTWPYHQCRAAAAASSQPQAGTTLSSGFRRLLLPSAGSTCLAAGRCLLLPLLSRERPGAVLAHDCPRAARALPAAAAPQLSRRGLTKQSSSRRLLFLLNRARNRSRMESRTD